MKGWGRGIGFLVIATLMGVLWQMGSGPLEKGSLVVQSSEAGSIWRVLQGNSVGYVVMMRHAEAPGVGDPAGFRLGDCSTQRNLSADGRSQATAIGEAFRRRQIRVVKVQSSQWCRCLETARLLNLGSVEPVPALNSFFRDASTEAQQTMAVRQWIVNNRTTRGVTILVTHQVNITALTGIFPRSGEAVVLKADLTGRIAVAGRLNPSGIN